MESTAEKVDLPSVSKEFSLLFCGERACQPGHSFGPAVREHYMMYYCISGHAVFQAGGKSYTLGPQEGFLVLPEEITFYQADLNDPCHCIWIAFSGTQAETHLARCGLSGKQRVFRCKEAEALSACLQQMLEHRKLSYSDEFFLQGLLYQWFALIAADSALPYEQNGPTKNLYVNKAVEYMQQNYQNDVTIAELSDYVCLNRSYLTSLFQRQMQMSPRDFLIHLRVEKACGLLYRSDLPVNQIAHSCGYPDPLAFSKAFHKLTGCSPSDYRTQKRAEKMPVLSQY